MSAKPRTIGLVGLFEDRRVAETLATLSEHLNGRDLAVLVHNGSQGAAGSRPPGATRVEREELGERADLVVAVGGDGTMLYAARLVARHGVPLVGINRGRLGFLADVGPEDMLGQLDAILDGRAVRESRLMLSAVLERDGEAVSETLALNDVVVQRSHAGRMLDVETCIDGVFVNTHGGDGLIVATPTGSTAYALSGGGPILAPDLEALVLVPICPHTLSDRPVVVGAGHEVTIAVIERPGSRAHVSCDGHLTCDFGGEDVLRVRVAPCRAELLHPPDYDYYTILRSKLSWGRGRTHQR